MNQPNYPYVYFLAFCSLYGLVSMFWRNQDHSSRLNRLFGGWWPLRAMISLSFGLAIPAILTWEAVFFRSTTLVLIVIWFVLAFVDLWMEPAKKLVVIKRVSFAHFRGHTSLLLRTDHGWFWVWDFQFSGKTLASLIQSKAKEKLTIVYSPIYRRVWAKSGSNWSASITRASVLGRFFWS